MTLHRNSALKAGVGQIFDRVLSELSLKMRALRMDQAEYVALKAIVLLNPGMYHHHDMTLHRNSARKAGVGQIFDRVLSELSLKMRALRMDQAEYVALKAIVLLNPGMYHHDDMTLHCQLSLKMRALRMDQAEYVALKAIVLLNPDVKGLKNRQEVDILREKMFSCLDEYCRRSRGGGGEEGRFASLLLRLPALRSISLKSFEHLFFFHLVADGHITGYIRDALRNHAPPINANISMGNSDVML
ncbi:ligand-binding domain of nuclear hormone receptor domain-containing protein [Phthorimaea operculella]|nr:ligand-binding domain of nuclear hormone receptor domain-containing protein [Phthorimaea operculella]